MGTRFRPMCRAPTFEPFPIPAPIASRGLRATRSATSRSGCRRLRTPSSTRSSGSRASTLSITSSAAHTSPASMISATSTPTGSATAGSPTGSATAHPMPSATPPPPIRRHRPARTAIPTATFCRLPRPWSSPMSSRAASSRPTAIHSPNHSPLSGLGQAICLTSTIPSRTSSNTAASRRTGGTGADGSAVPWKARCRQARNAVTTLPRILHSSRTPTATAWTTAGNTTSGRPSFMRSAQKPSGGLSPPDSTTSMASHPPMTTL